MTKKKISPEAAPVNAAALVGRDVPSVFDFEGRKLTVLMRGGKPYVVASELGEAMGYSEGKRLVNHITGEWGNEFIEGTDFVKVHGADAAAITSALSASKNAGAFESTESVLPKKDGRGGVRTLLLLTWQGMQLAIVKSHKPAGVKMRRWLVDVVLPAVQGTATLQTANPTDLRRAIRAEMSREFMTSQSRHDEFMRLAGVAAHAICDRTGAPVGMMRGWVVSVAQGVVGYGGGGRELAMMSPRQFKAARAFLKMLPTMAEVLPKKRARKVIAQLGGSQQIGLFDALFSVNDDTNVRVTVSAEKKAA